MPDATSLHHCLKNKQLKPNNAFRKEITYTLQSRFCKVDYRPINVQCPNSTQDNTILMMVLEAVTGIDRHPDRTEIYFRLQIQGNPKLIPCSRTF